VLSLICLTAAVIYSNTFDAPFVFDDQHTIQQNAKIRDMRNFYTPDVLRSPRPLVDFTFALNYHFGKLRVFGYHLVNLFIHIANGVLVFFLSRIMFRKLSGADNPNSYLAALFAALIFIAHPLQTQAVTYTAQRYTEMAAFFYLGSVLGYIIARDAKFAGKLVACCGFFLVSFVCGLLAFLSKQNSASLPMAILLVEYAIYDKTWQGWKNKIGFILPGVLLCGLFYAYNLGLFRHDIQFGTFLEDVSEAARETKQVSRWHYLCSQFNVISIYIRLLFIPMLQNLDYQYGFKDGFFDGATAFLFVFLVGILCAAWWNRNKRPILFVGILWFFITLSVESSIFPIKDALFEHRLYLPMFGFSLIVSYGIFLGLAAHRFWVYGVSVTIVMSLAAATYQRNEIWKNAVSLWSDVIKKNPSNYRGIANLAYALEQDGKTEAAISYYDKAIQLKPDYHFALSNKGAVLGRMGKTNDAVQLFQKALQYKPGYPLALNNMGVALASRNRFKEAIAYFQKAIQAQPEYLDAHNNLATAFQQAGDYENALLACLKIIQLDPDNAAMHNSAGVLLHIRERYTEAIEQYTESITLDPTYSEVYFNKGNSQLAAKMFAEAVDTYKLAVQKDPVMVEGFTNMGMAYMRMGNNDEAINAFTEALKINPNLVEAHANLGLLYHLQGNVIKSLEYMSTALRLKPDSTEIRNNLERIINARTSAPEKKPMNTN
jgi:tetratricopeptide (TPR) repeat protein